MVLIKKSVGCCPPLPPECKTRSSWPRPSACCSAVSRPEPQLDTCIQAAPMQRRRSQTLLKIKRKSGSVFVLCCSIPNYHKCSSLIQHKLIISVLEVRSSGGLSWTLCSELAKPESRCELAGRVSRHSGARLCSQFHFDCSRSLLPWLLD